MSKEFLRKEKVLEFPKNFLWGAATSAHQVEGGNVNDWSEWEKKNAERLAKKAKGYWQSWQQKKFPEMFKPKNYISGQACDHYNRYKDDFRLAKEMNIKAFRLSIEWSRIEPKEGVWDYRELEHYRSVLKTLKEMNFTICLTLWHWTSPVWLAEKGGWANKKVVFYFSRYTEFIARNLGGYVDMWIPLNEPMVPIGFYIIKMGPLSKKMSIFNISRMFFNLIRAYKNSYQVIHKIYPEAKVSITQLTNYFEPAHKWCPIEKLFVYIAHFFHQHYFYLLVKKHLDYIGLDYYHHDRIVWYPPFKKNKNKKVTDMGWEIYPEGIYHVLKYLSKFNKPIYITENGLADARDSRRAQFIIDHLKWIHRAIAEGVDVRGYFHWSLLDNFEWNKGFWPRFGLVEVDYKTLERKMRPSAKVYAEICKNNRIKMNNIR